MYQRNQVGFHLISRTEQYKIRKKFEDFWHSNVTHSAVPVRFQEEWRDNGMGATFAQAISDRHRRDHMGRFLISSFQEQS